MDQTDIDYWANVKQKAQAIAARHHEEAYTLDTSRDRATATIRHYGWKRAAEAIAEALELETTDPIGP